MEKNLNVKDHNILSKNMVFIHKLKEPEKLVTNVSGHLKELAINSDGAKAHTLPCKRRHNL